MLRESVDIWRLTLSKNVEYPCFLSLRSVLVRIQAVKQLMHQEMLSLIFACFVFSLNVKNIVQHSITYSLTFDKHLCFFLRIIVIYIVKRPLVIDACSSIVRFQGEHMSARNSVPRGGKWKIYLFTCFRRIAYGNEWVTDRLRGAGWDSDSRKEGTVRSSVCVSTRGGRE